MEGSRSRRVEKRVYEESLEDQDGGKPNLKKPKVPGLARSFLQIIIYKLLLRIFLFLLEGVLRMLDFLFCWNSWC